MLGSSTGPRARSATSRRCSICTAAGGCRSAVFAARLPLDAVDEAFGSCAMAAPDASSSTSTERRHERARRRRALDGPTRWAPGSRRRGPPLRGNAGPAVPRGVGPARARDGEATPRHRALGEDGGRGYAQRRRLPDAARSSACSSAWTRCAPRPCARSSRPSTSTADARGPSRCAIWDLAGRLIDQPLWRLLGGRNERLIAYASTGELVGRRGARAPRGRHCATAACARVEDPLPSR